MSGQELTERQAGTPAIDAQGGVCQNAGNPAGAMKPKFASMTVGLTLGVTAAVVAACTTAAYFYSTHHFKSLIGTARDGALAKAELIRVALEHQMIENDRTLIARMVESFGNQPRVEHVAVLDRYGTQRYAGGPRKLTEELRIDSPTCQACHRFPPEKRGSSRVIESRGGTVLRTVVPVRNRPECHRCHDPKHSINGILILDSDIGEVRAAMTQDLGWMIAGTGALTLLLVGAIALLIRLVVLKRLQRFETTARQIAAGDLERRVPAEGSDTIAWLAREFNTMAESVIGLVGDVRTERERLETVINSIDDGIVVLDPERRMIAANDAFLERTGHSRAQVLGCSCRDAAPGACNVADCPTLACVRSGGRQVRICERRKTGGGVAWEEVHASPIVDAAGRVVQVVEVWRDISDRRAAEAHLAESHRMASLGMLASGFSHELNTPLATVLTCVEGILREVQPAGGGVDWSRIRESASIARDQILRCRGITQHFLRLSRGQRTAGDLVDIASAIAAVVRLVEPTARAQSVAIEVGPLPERLVVRAGEAELQQALVNLLLNAVQASKPGGSVTIGAEAGDAVRIRVADAGCGIAPEHLARIFEPFFSLREGGTGLGLFLSLNSVRRWGGDIVVESAEGRGSAFEIVLPAFAQEAARESPHFHSSRG
ncbi:MAG TPA: ATP-binding protein [Bryobacteraceae bacterium]|nr:ATP-binding protein [Bryobacteraceae bacterium]